MNSTPELAEQVNELRWLVCELGNERDALATTPYPQVHRFLMHNLTRRITKVAQATGERLSQFTPTPVACPEVQPIEQQSA